MAPDDRLSADRLDSWKEIAAYLGREVRTVLGWEKTEGLPVHRHQHARQGSVYAFKSELDSWREARRSTPEAANVTAIPETPIPETAIPPTDLGPKIPAAAGVEEPPPPQPSRATAASP